MTIEVAVVVHHDVALPDLGSGAPSCTTGMTTLLIDGVPVLNSVTLNKVKITVGKGCIVHVQRTSCRLIIAIFVSVVVENLYF